jgi:hypothetical protein
MVDVSHGEGPSVRVERFARLATLLSAALTLPVHLVLEACGDLLPVRWVLVAIHGHGLPSLFLGFSTSSRSAVSMNQSGSTIGNIFLFV